MTVLGTCKFDKDPIKNEVAILRTTFSPLQVNGSFWFPWKPEFWSDLLQMLMLMQPDDATHKIWSRLANLPQRYSSSKVWMDGGWSTDGGPLVYYKLTLWAFRSGELKPWET